MHGTRKFRPPCVYWGGGGTVQVQCFDNFLSHQLILQKGKGSVPVYLIRESPPQFENRSMARVYVRSITRSTMHQKAPFC